MFEYRKWWQSNLRSDEFLILVKKRKNLLLIKSKSEPFSLVEISFETDGNLDHNSMKFLSKKFADKNIILKKIWKMCELLRIFCERMYVWYDSIVKKKSTSLVGTSNNEMMLRNFGHVYFVTKKIKINSQTLRTHHILKRNK